jgi:hypothetical protein
LLFGHLIASGSQDQVAIGFFIGAAVMALGGITELLFGVRAEQKQLEDIAEPLSAEEGGGEDSEPAGSPVSRSRGMPLWAPADTGAGREQEIATIERALNEHGTATRRELTRRTGARYWGPGRMQLALRQAVIEGRVRRLSRDRYATATGTADKSSGTAGVRRSG